MNILIVANDLGQFNITLDSTYFIMQTAQSLGHSIFCCLGKDLFSIKQQLFVKAESIHVNNNKLDPNWFTVQATDTFSITKFGLVLIRLDPPVDIEYVYLSYMLDLAIAAGVTVINHPSIIRNYNEKLAILHFPHLIIDTLVSKEQDALLAFLYEHVECVIKPLGLMAGRGVFKLNYHDANKSSIIDAVTHGYQHTVMLQKFIPAVINGDKRIFIVAGKVMDVCLKRVPQGNDIRSNIAAGGRGVVEPISIADKQLAMEVAAFCFANNIYLAGIDVIDCYLNEINITSPAGMKEIYDISGLNIATVLLESVLQAISADQAQA